MNDRHLSQAEQEAYILGEKTPEQARHMAVCAACRAGVARLEYSIARFRESSLQWAEDCMESRLRRAPQPESVRAAKVWAPKLGLAFAAMFALVAFLFHPMFHVATAPIPAPPAASAPTAVLNDDALLEQVDQQLAAGVPDSMHSLTHLVSAGNGVEGSAQHE